MPNIEIRDIPDDWLEMLHANANLRRQSLQEYLREIVENETTRYPNLVALKRVERWIAAGGGVGLSIEDILAVKNEPQYPD